MALSFCAISTSTAKANVPCQDFIVICYESYYVHGEVCAPTAEDRQIIVELNAEAICDFDL